MFKKINILLILIGLFLGVFTRPILATDYFGIGESLWSNTVSISGTTGDLQTDDTNYRILRSFPSAYNGDYQTTAVDVTSTIPTTSYVDKASLTWTVPANGDYLIYSTAEFKRGSTTALRTAKVQMTIGGTSFAETFATDDNDVDLYRTFSGFRVVSLAAGSRTVKIQAARTNTTSNICSIRNARITAMRIDNDQFNVPANGTTTSASYADIATLTFTPKITEDWLVVAHADVTHSTTTALSYANLMVGSTQLAEGVYKTIYAAYFMPFDVYDTVSLTANTSYTFKIQMKTSASTLTYKNVGLYAIPKSIFRASATAESIGQTSCSTCVVGSAINIATLNLNTGIGGTYLITATGEQGTGSTAAFSGIRLNVGSSVAQSLVDVGTTLNYSSFSLQKVVSLSTGATNISVQLYTQTSGQTVKARNVRINAIKLGAASAQKMEVEYSGIGNTLSWTSLDYLLTSGFSVASVGTTLQLWNYNSSAYPTTGNGFYSYTSSGTANTFENGAQSISTNPTYFRNATTGAWKLKILAQTTSPVWIDWSGNLLKYTPTIAVASTAPVIPTLSLPTTGTSGVSLTPTFKTVTTDANDDNLQYELKICTNSGMSVGCTTFDQSASNTGWSGQDIGTSAYASGTTATYILQVGNSLVEGTVYYWKTRAKDYAGTNTWSSTQATPNSFVTNSKPNTPTLILPTTGTTAVSQTPTLKTVATDINSDSLQYKIELATSSNFTGTTQSFDLSVSSTGWSGIDVGTSAYASGTTAVYIIPVGSSLAFSTTYYWRTSVKDPSGTNRWSTTQGTPFSFTTVAPPVPVLTQSSFRWSADDVSGESRTGGVGDTWYDVNYDYRTPITVTNNVGITLTDFQVRLTIGTSALIAAGKMNSDCSDVRITDEDKETSLSYWIESNCNVGSSDAVIWVKVPNLAASTTRTLYLYYGYSSATSLSIGDSTFDAFDDFDGTSLDTNKWVDENPNSFGTMSIAGGTLAINMPSVGSPVTWTYRGIMSANQFNFNNHIIEVRHNWIFPNETVTGEGMSKQIVISDNQSSVCAAGRNYYKFVYHNTKGTFSVTREYYMDKCASGTITGYGKTASSNDAPANFEQEKYSFFTNSGTKETSGRSTNDGSSYSAIWAQQSQTILPLPGSYYWGFTAENVSTKIQNVFVDWIRIRKYASTEPTESLGTETTQPPPASAGATWLAAENVGITEVSPNANIRLRFSVGDTSAEGSFNFRLQVAPKGGSTNCTDVSSGNFSDVPTTAGSAVAVMTTSPNFTNQEATTNQLTASGTTFVAGKIVEYSSNQSDSITLAPTEFTEVEYNFQMTSNAGSTAPYCFRVVNVGTTLNTYTQVSQLTMTTLITNAAPSAPYLPYANNTSAQSGQQTPVYGLIDHTPAFSAVFDDPDTSDTSSFYQLQINTDAGFTGTSIWDSNKSSIGSTCNENARCGDIVYGGGTSLVDGSTYYWRIKFWDNSDVDSSWSATQQFSMNNAPTVSNVVINGNSSINLSEGLTFPISWTSTVSDADNYTNLSSVTGKIYRSGLGSTCTLNNNNCYTDATCDMSGCAGNSCTATCSANIYFFTEATDAGSTFASQYYQAWVQATDSRTEIGSTTSSSTTIDVNSISGFSIGTSLVYGEVFAGSNTGSSNTVTTVTNTGNSLINLEITGDFMCTDYPSCGAQTIAPQNQQYKLTTFTFGAGTTLTTLPQVVNIGISKATQSPSNSYKNLYWGISIPTLKEPGNYQGATTILVY